MAGIGVIGIVFALCVSFLHKTKPFLYCPYTYQGLIYYVPTEF